MQVACRGEAIAAVVAGPAENEDAGALGIIQGVERDFGEVEGGVFHQDDGRDAELGDGEAVDLADGLAREDVHEIVGSPGGRCGSFTLSGGGVPRIMPGHGGVYAWDEACTLGPECRLCLSSWPYCWT